MPTDRRTAQITAAIVAGALVWLILLFVVWAGQPLSDTVIVGVDEDGRRVSADVECNTLFDAEPIDPAEAAVINAVDPAIAEQEPCESVHSQARMLAVVNVVLVGAAIAGALVFAARGRGGGRDDVTTNRVTSNVDSS